MTESAIDLSGEADFSVGTLRVRPASREAGSGDKMETIEPRVMQALIALARRRGTVVSRDQLINECWDGRVVGEDAINRCIAKVRKLATTDTFELETIPRVGYRLIEAAPAPNAATIDVRLAAQGADVAAAPRSRMSPRKRRILIGVAIAAVVMVGGWLYGMWWTMQSMGASSISEVWTLMNVGSRPTFAVLPFDAEGKSGDSDFLADAIPTAINNQLVGLGFQGVSPALTFQYRGERKARAAEDLGPRYVIDGSVRTIGDKLQVTARMDSALQPISLWSQTFEVNLHEASDLPSRIATALSNLSVFRGMARSQTAISPTLTAPLLRVNEMLRVGDDLSAYRLAKDLLRNNPNAWAVQSAFVSATNLALDLLPPGERAAALDQARDAAQAVATIAANGAPLLVQSVMPGIDWSAREQILVKGTDVGASAAPRAALAALLLSTGRLADANSISRVTAVIDPLSSRDQWVYATALELTGRREETAAVLARAERLWPNLELLELLRFSHAMSSGDLQTASKMLRDPKLQAILDPPAERRPYGAILRALSARDPQAIADVERDCAEPAKLARYRNGLCLRALVILGRIDTFFKVAPLYFPDQRGATPEERDERWLKDPQAWRTLRFLFHADAAALRADERIIPLFAAMGLPDYWRASGKWPDFCRTEPNSVCGRMRAQ